MHFFCESTLTFVYLQIYHWQSHKKARPYEQGCPLYHSLQQLVPSDAKGQKAYHGRLAAQPHSTAIAADNSDDPDAEDGNGNGEDDEGDNDAGGGGLNATGRSEAAAEMVVVGGELGTPTEVCWR